LRKRTLKPHEPSQITERMLFEIADNLQKKIPPLPKLSIVDDKVVGLRFIVYNTGIIAIHASYTVGERRPFMKIGELQKDSEEHLSLADARELTKAIKAIGDRGIDVQKAQRDRLILELLRDGPKWKPVPNAPAK
jgi:hypothetical protein